MRLVLAGRHQYEVLTPKEAALVSSASFAILDVKIENGKQCKEGLSMGFFISRTKAITALHSVQSMGMGSTVTIQFPGMDLKLII